MASRERDVGRIYASGSQKNLIRVMVNDNENGMMIVIILNVMGI